MLFSLIVESEKKKKIRHTQTHICTKPTLLFIGGSQNTISKTNPGILELKKNVT